MLQLWVVSELVSERVCEGVSNGAFAFWEKQTTEVTCVSARMEVGSTAVRVCEGHVRAELL